MPNIKIHFFTNCNRSRNIAVNVDERWIWHSGHFKLGSQLKFCMQIVSLGNTVIYRVINFECISCKISYSSWNGNKQSIMLSHRQSSHSYEFLIPTACACLNGILNKIIFPRAFDTWHVKRTPCVSRNLAWDVFLNVDWMN